MLQRMQLSELLSIIAVLVSVCSLMITLWNARRAINREDGLDGADIVLRYSPDSGTIDIDNEGPNNALQVSLLATGPNLSLGMHSFGTVPAGEVRQYQVRAPLEFLVYLTWRDSRARVHRKKYRLTPGQAGLQGDGWPEMMQFLRPGVPREQALKRLDKSGKWKMHEPELWRTRG